MCSIYVRTWYRRSFMLLIYNINGFVHYTGAGSKLLASRYAYIKISNPFLNERKMKDKHKYMLRIILSQQQRLPGKSMAIQI